MREIRVPPKDRMCKWKPGHRCDHTRSDVTRRNEPIQARLDEDAVSWARGAGKQARQRQQVHWAGARDLTFAAFVVGASIHRASTISRLGAAVLDSDA
jgi:hypothetical protein